MKARVTVTLKTGILDPQGKAIEGALALARRRGRRQRAPGQGVRHRDREAGDAAKAEALLKQAADKLLANTVIENYQSRWIVVSAHESRRPRLSRHQPRARHGAHARLVSGREPAMVWHAETRAARRHRSRRDPGRLFLRRLSALRRHRGARADHGRGARLRRAKAGWCSASATASRSCARPACCRAC